MLSGGYNEKKEEKTERTKQKILAAAMEEFGTNGYAGASLNNICSVGIPKGLLYHNFKNKDSIYLACVGQCFSTLTEYLRAADIGSDLQKYMDARLRFFHEHEKETRLFFLKQFFSRRRHCVISLRICGRSLTS